MVETSQGKILGWLGVLCLAIVLMVRLAPQTADDLFGVSTTGKFIAIGIFLAAATLPTIAAVRGSKWWLVVAAVSLITLVDSYVRFAGPRR